MAGRFSGTSRKALVLVLLAAGATYASDGNGTSETSREPAVPNRTLQLGQKQQHTLQPTISAIAGMDGDVFPAFANHLSLEPAAKREWGVVQVKIADPASSESVLRARISVRIPGWSDEEIQNVSVVPGMTKTVSFAPSLRDRAFKNNEIAPATAQVTATDQDGALLYADSVPLRMRASEDMYWGSKFQFAPYIASWVTPHDPAVEKVLSRAKEYMPGRRLPGYEPWKSPDEQEVSTRLQARAIYRALQQQGVSYVKSSTTFGSNQHAAVSQRIRTPRDSINNNSANCIDGAVMFASLFENLGMDPQIIVVPGHAYVGVRVAERSNRYLLIDTSIVGRVPFDKAVATAERGITQWNDRDVTHVYVTAARQQGIFPMPDIR